MVLRLAKPWLSGQSLALRSLRQRGARVIAPLGVVAVGIVPPPLMSLILLGRVAALLAIYLSLDAAISGPLRGGNDGQRLKIQAAASAQDASYRRNHQRLDGVHAVLRLLEHP